jgi:hypothetical protein
MPLDRSLWEFLRFVFETAGQWLLEHEPEQEEASEQSEQEPAEQTATPATTVTAVNDEVESLNISGYSSTDDYAVRAGTTYIQCHCCANAAVHLCARRRGANRQDWHCGAHTPRNCAHFVEGLPQHHQCVNLPPLRRPVVGRRTPGVSFERTPAGPRRT